MLTIPSTIASPSTPPFHSLSSSTASPSISFQQCKNFYFSLFGFKSRRFRFLKPCSSLRQIKKQQQQTLSKAPNSVPEKDENIDSDSPGGDEAAVKGTILAGLLVVGVVGGFGTVGYIYKDQINAFLTQFSGIIEGYGPAGYALFVAVYAGLEILAIPAIPLTLSAGLLFGSVTGTVIVSISGTVAASVAFLIARYFARERILKLVEGNKKFLAIDKAIGENGFRVVTLLRLSPLLPFSLGNYLYGLTSVNWLGMLPGTWAYVSAGAFGRAVIQEESEVGLSGGNGQLWSLGLGLLATALAATYVTRLAKIVKQALLPRVHGLALKTTVAVVRVNALLCLSDMVRILDKNAVLDILQTIQQCTAVDHSAPTLMCTLGVANSILKQVCDVLTKLAWMKVFCVNTAESYLVVFAFASLSLFGIEFVAEYVLPLLIPLLITQQLNVQQFAKHMLFVKDVLRKIEEQRGVTLTDGGISEVRPLPAAERSTLGQMNKTATNTPSTTKRNFWDEDWIPGKVASTAVQSLSITSNTQPAIPSQPVQVNSRYDISSMASVTSNQELPSACAAVDVEWPPRSSSGVTAQYDEIEMLNGNKGPPSDSRLNIIDPFANWPPRPSATPSVSNSFNNGMTASSVNNFELSNSATTNGLSFQSGSWAFGLQNYSVSNSQNQGTGKSPNVDSVSSGGLNSQKSLGYMKQNHGISALGSSHERTADLGSIFATNKNDQIAPRLAPPPTTVVGKVRGGRGSQGLVRSSQIKSKTDQPPLLDLL